MPIEIRQPHREDRKKILETLTKGLRPKVDWKLETEYPTILAEENRDHTLIALDGDVVIAHAAYYPFIVESSLGAFRGAAIGQVWTHPAYRGKGIATSILKKLEEKMRSEKFAFAILWTGEPSIYIKAGYVRAGREIDWFFEKHHASLFRRSLGRPLAVRKLSEKITRQNLPVITGLHATHRLHIHRSKKEWEAYTRVPQSQWWMTESGDAYAVVGKGADLTNVVHEWGGTVDGMLALLAAIIDDADDRVFLMSPDDPREGLPNRLKSMGVVQAEGIVGYMLRLNLDRYTFEKLAQNKTSEFFFWGFDSV